MSRVLLRTGVLALACLVVSEFQVNAAEKPVAKGLALQSRYSDTPFFGFNRQISLGAGIDDKGGLGILTFDPNIRKGRESTKIDIKTILVRLKVVQDETETAKGRRLYELREFVWGDDGPVCWLLAVPLKKGAPCWLMSVDENGKFQDIVMLKHSWMP